MFHNKYALHISSYQLILSLISSYLGHIQGQYINGDTSVQNAESSTFALRQKTPCIIRI